MNLKSIGEIFFLFGAGSSLLSFLNMEFFFLMWIDNWGTDVGWGIRIGLTIIGAALWIISKRHDHSQ